MVLLLEYTHQHTQQTNTFIHHKVVSLQIASLLRPHTTPTIDQDAMLLVTVHHVFSYKIYVYDDVLIIPHEVK